METPIDWTSLAQDHEQRASEAMQKIAASMEKASMAG